MYCSKCGTQNPDDATFCGKCGSNLSSVKPEKKGITSKLGKMGIPGFRSGKLWKMALATIAYFFIGMMILGAIFGGNNNSNTETISSVQAPTSPTLYLSSADVLPNIQEMPSGAKLTGEVLNKKIAENLEASERDFRLESEAIEIRYISTKFTTVEEAKSGFTAVKEQKLQTYKIENVNVGDEAFLYSDYVWDFIILRKNNVYVIVQSNAINKEYAISYARLLKV
jgi:hypothetical protein